MTPDLLDNIRQVARVLAEAKQACCMTGAGVSAESGVATFRGPDGLWEGRRPEEVATPEAFHRDPEDVWRFYLMRRQQLGDRRPNPGHRALAALDRLVPQFTVLTQNVDGLHRAAGSRDVIELHGDVWINRCTGDRRAPVGPPCPEVRGTPEDGFEQIPHCPACGSLMRPGVVWFGEMLPREAFARAERIAGECQVMLVVGTSSVIYPAAGLALVASGSGATVVEVNPDSTPLSARADYCLPGPSGELLPVLVEELEKLRG